MNHLSHSEIVDLAEGTLEQSRRAHADGCHACRDAVADLRRMLEMTTVAGGGEVPEPSPLFWDHLSARVREAIAAEPAPRRQWIVWRPAFAALAGVLVAVTVLGSLMLRRETAVVSGPSAGAAASAAMSTPDSASIDAGRDATVEGNTDVWEVLTAAAADLELDAARDAGMSVQSAAIDGAVHRMNADELNELGRLLQSEMKRAGN